MLKTPKEKKANLKEASKIEKQLDKLEKRLGVDGEDVMKFYYELNEELFDEEMKQAGSREIIEDLKAGKNIEINRFSSNKLMRLAACFLFLTIGAWQGGQEEAEGAEQVGIYQKIEKTEVDEFLSELKIVEKFHKQKYLDMDIPAKPKGHEHENWEIQIIDDSGSTVGHVIIDEKSFHEVFGKNNDMKIKKARLSIKKAGKFEMLDIDIPGEKEVIAGSREYQKNTETEYEKIIEKIESQKLYDEMFRMIFEVLDANEISEAVRYKVEDYFMKNASEYIENLLKMIDGAELESTLDEFSSIMVSNFFKNAMLEFSASDSISERVKDFIAEKENFVARKLYAYDTGELHGEDKLKKVSEFPLKYNNILHEDSELVEVIRNKVEELAKTIDNDEAERVFGELGQLFDWCDFPKGSGLSSLQEEYSGLKKEFDEKANQPVYDFLNKLQEDSAKESREKATEDYLIKIMKSNR